MTPQHTLRLAFLTLGSLSAALCWAGRPLSVDDANVNDAGAGHVETWVTRQSAGAQLWTLAPAYGLSDGVEIAATFARDTSNRTTATALQAKFRLSPSRPDGCNVGASIGVARSNDGSGSTPYLTGLATCNLPVGALHLNLGANKPSANATLGTWGVAFEREFGAVTGHVECFGQQRDKPTIQLGLRGEIMSKFQLDGTVGRTAGETLYSLGLKLQF